MPDWIVGFLTASALAIVGWFLALLQRRISKRDEQREAVAALRFELQSNLGWIEDILETRNYLRDEAWVIMKNKGYISYLRKPIPKKVIGVYDQLHGLNERVRVIKETQNGVGRNYDRSDTDHQKMQLKNSIKDLMTLLDNEYPKIGKNFQEK